MAQTENPATTQDSGGDQNTVVPPKNSTLTPMPADEGSTGGQEQQEGSGKPSPSLTTPTREP